MNRADFIQPPCVCGACVQAGVSALEQMRDYQTGRWLHGYELKRWYAARQHFYDDVAATTIKTFAAIATVASREPGEDG